MTDYLNLLGITRWKKRPSCTNPQFYLCKLTKGSATQGYILADIKADKAAELALLRKIAEATQFAVTITAVKEVPELSVATLALGKIHGFNGETTHAVASLLKTPGLKREVWDKVKAIFPIVK